MIKIEGAVESDLREISRIFFEESTKPPYNQDWTEQSAFEKIRKSFFTKETNNIFVAIDNDIIIGFGIIIVDKQKKSVYLDELWFTKAEQGRGAGKKIMEFMQRFYKNKGFRTMSLTANKEAQAVGFYEKLGFTTKHVHLHMTKSLE